MPAARLSISISSAHRFRADEMFNEEISLDKLKPSSSAAQGANLSINFVRFYRSDMIYNPKQGCMNWTALLIVMDFN